MTSIMCESEKQKPRDNRKWEGSRWGWESHQTMVWIRPKWSREGRKVENILDCCAILRSVWQGHWRVIKLKSLITGVPFPFCIQSLLEAALDLNKLWKILLVKFLEFVKKLFPNQQMDERMIHQLCTFNINIIRGRGEGQIHFLYFVLWFQNWI